MRTFIATGSANIRSVGYDSRKKLLRVIFIGSPHWYEYTEVPPSIAAELFVSDSLGSSFDSLVKKGVSSGLFKCVKIEDPRSTPDGKAYWDEVFHSATPSEATS